MVEEWRTVKQNKDYEVSNLGSVRSLKTKTPTVLKTFTGKRWGYSRINLMTDSKLKQVQVHRLVAEAFIGDVDGKFINHINGVKTDNRVENLEIVTAKENMRHSVDILGNLRKPVIQIDISTGEIIKEFSSITVASKETKIENSSISHCCRGIRNKAGGFKWEFKK